MIVSDPESDGEGPNSTHLVEAAPRSEIPIERTCDAKINSTFRIILSRLVRQPTRKHRKLSLNVTDRNRIEEFGKQEFSLMRAFGSDSVAMGLQPMLTTSERAGCPISNPNVDLNPTLRNANAIGKPLRARRSRE